MIDPVAAVVALLRTDAELGDLVGTQVAVKHQYGQTAPAGWPAGSSGLVVRADGGYPDHYVGVHDARLEVRCYGSSSRAAALVWQRVVALCRLYERITVATADGTALIYALMLDSGSSQLWDDEISMDFYLVFLRALVAERAV